MPSSTFRKPAAHAHASARGHARIARSLVGALLALPLLPGCASTSAAPAPAGPASPISGAEATGDMLEPGSYALGVLGMSCPKCVSNVDLQLSRIEGIARPKVDMRHGIVTFEVPGPVRPRRDAVAQAILDAGFTLREIRKLDAKEGA